MKKFATILLVVVTTATASNAQWSYNYSSGNYQYYEDGYDREYDNSDDNNYYENRRRKEYKRNKRIYHRMNNRDQRRYRKLLRKLQYRQESAWDDGYLSRREKRRIREVKNEIDVLISRYISQRGSANSRRFRGNPCR